MHFQALPNVDRALPTTDLLAHNQDVVGTFLRCKLLALKEVVGANGF